MTREIRFRAWDTKAKAWAKWEDNFIGQDGKLHVRGNDHLILEQFTGLHDSKGREIYEGDIVEYVDMPFYRKRYKVEFGNFSFDGGHYRYQYHGFGLVPIECDDMEDHWRLIEGDIEVIGNIHENPEILR